MSEWSKSDTAPRDRAIVILLNHEPMPMIFRWNDIEGNWQSSCSSIYEDEISFLWHEMPNEELLNEICLGNLDLL